jgi:hypothetical protein
MASEVVIGGGVTVVPAECCRCDEATPAAVTVWPLAHRDCPALEREVASPSVSRSW